MVTPFYFLKHKYNYYWISKNSNDNKIKNKHFAESVCDIFAPYLSAFRGVAPCWTVIRNNANYRHPCILSSHLCCKDLTRPKQTEAKSERRIFCGMIVLKYVVFTKTKNSRMCVRFNDCACILFGVRYFQNMIYEWGCVRWLLRMRRNLLVCVFTDSQHCFLQWCFCHMLVVP